MPIVLNLLKSKSVWIVLAVLAAFSYHYFTVTGLEKNILKRDLVISRLSSDLGTAEGNTKKCTTTNKDNLDLLEKYQSDVAIVEGHYVGVITGKDKIILRLRNDIIELSTPVDYPEEIIYKDCKFKFKTVKDINETDKNYSTFKSLLNIGN